MRRTLPMRIYITAYVLLFGFLTYLGLAVAGVVPPFAERDQSVPLETVLVFITVGSLMLVGLGTLIVAAIASYRDARRAAAESRSMH